jgi:hypothetical protein
MKKVIIILVASGILFGMISGCEKNTSIVGRYVNKSDEGEYLLLNQDGTFEKAKEMRRIYKGSEGLKLEGNWKIKGDTLILTYTNPSGLSATAKTKSNTLIEEDGPIWEKTKRPSSDVKGQSFQNGISGKYANKETKGKLPRGVSFVFKKDGTYSLRIPYKWKIEGNLLRAEIEKGDVIEGEILENSIGGLSRGLTLIKQEGGRQIEKLREGRLWSKYTIQGYRIPKGASLEFKRDGTGIYTIPGEWELKGDVIKVKIGDHSAEGKIKGNTITLNGFGTFEKQAPTTKILIYAGIILIGISLFFVCVLIRQRMIRATNLKSRVASRFIFCTQCGEENSAQASFCTNCGQRLE